MTCWDSKRIIGNVHQAYEHFKARNARKFEDFPERDREWVAFYNGWLEGRIDMLNEIFCKEE